MSIGKKYDLIIIGAGIIGVGIAHEVAFNSAFLRLKKQRASKLRILILEKEGKPALHQTGRNSGVLHSGIYYKPGSLKAEFCRQGRARIVKFCQKHGIAYDICGKMIVALKEEELPTLNLLWKRSQENRVKAKQLSPEQVKKIEPEVKCIAGILVPECGIVDYPAVVNKMLEEISDVATVQYHSRVEKVEREGSGYQVHVSEKGSSVSVSASACYTADQVINCAGLYSDEISRRSGISLNHQIIPFRGEYYQLKESSRSLVKNLIYPVPDMTFPFLGVHFTRMINGSVECGPNAVLALGRESYSKYQIHPAELLRTLRFKGFWEVAKQYWRPGWDEMVRSWSKKAFLRSLQRLIPAIEMEDLEPAPSGIRAQAVREDGSFVDDFYIRKVENFVQVWNTPSPAATSSLEIARAVVNFVNNSDVREEAWLE